MKAQFRTLRIKLKHWEYWPMWLVYLPVSFYYVFLAIKARSLFFFSATNPSIENGGMFFESKWKIFELIPKQYYPSTVLVNAGDSAAIMLEKIHAARITFPMIAKPDRGERGWGVEKLADLDALLGYRKKTRLDFLVQDYVDLPQEFSVFYYRHPKSDRGKVTSVTLKQLLTVRGDGKSTLAELIHSHDRAFLQFEKLARDPSLDMRDVLATGQSQVLVPYGNHARGAMFLNYNQIIDQALCTTFDHISKQIEGFYFGRFDLRCTTIDDLKQGKNIAILELNGCGAEPGHIYDPSFSYLKAQKVLAQHYRLMYEAALQNQTGGVPFLTYQNFKNCRQAEKIYKSTYAIL
jgi:hypothetical protein